MQRTSVELFAGGGGLVQASTNTGFRHLLLNEFAKRACETLEGNRFEKFPADVDSDVLAKWLDQIDEQRAEGFEVAGAVEPPHYPPLVTGDVRELDMRFHRWGPTGGASAVETDTPPPTAPTRTCGTGCWKVTGSESSA